MEIETAWSQDISQCVRNKKCGVDSSDTRGLPPTCSEHNKEPSLKLRLLSAGMLWHVFQYKWTSAGHYIPEDCDLHSHCYENWIATILKLYPDVLLHESNISVFAVNTMCILAIIHY
jgi:hypothetical protein